MAMPTAIPAPTIGAVARAAAPLAELAVRIVALA
jgi:hypothetical protein